jgi:release factor glutamine methyltransferase
MTDDEAESGRGQERSRSDESRGRPRLADERGIEMVYQPAEDSRMLAETVVGHVESEDRVLDVGTGSGYVAARVAEATGATVVGSDINPDACRQAREAGVPAVRADMFGPFCDKSFNVVVCNPPYLPTPPEREWDDWMEQALSGGEDGRAMVDPFVEGAGRVLGEGGVAYLLVSTLTGLDAVRETATDSGFETAVVAEESHPFERLVVFELARSTDGPRKHNP